MGNDNMSENNKLIFLDVDATLYSKEQRLVPESTIKAIHEAQENGHKVLINTGRPLVYFEKEILDIGCDGYLCSNGVHILLDGETIYHKTVPETVVEPIISMEHLREKNVLISAIITLTFIHIMDL